MSTFLHYIIEISRRMVYNYIKYRKNGDTPTMSLGERLKELRKNHRLSQQELADAIGCSHQSISKYENDENMEKIKIIKSLSNYFNVSTDYLIRGAESKALGKLAVDEEKFISKYRNLTPHDKEIVNYIMDMEQVEESPAKTIYRFPVYNQDAAAGVGQLGRDGNYNMEEFVVDNIPDNAIFAMRISGESMNSENTNNLICTGSIVLINPKFDESELDDKIVIANFRGEIICKRYVDQGNYILFQSDNDEFEEENRKSSDDPEYKVIGIVLGVVEEEKFIKVK